MKRFRCIRLMMPLFLFVLLTGPVFGQKVIPLKELRKPETITVDDKQIYIVEMESIYIYSLKDFKLVKKFGQAGEGPQEFKISDASGVRIFVHPEYILVKSLGRISYFTLDGKYIKEKINVDAGIWVQPLGNRFIGQGRVREDDTVYLTIHFFDSNLKKGKEIFRIKHWFDGKKIDPILHGRFRLARRGNPIFYANDNRIFVEGGENGDIHVFDFNGEKLYHTHYEYEKRKVKQKDIKDVLAFFKLIQSSLLRHEHRYVYPEYFPMLRFFNVAGGKVYVLPYKKKNGKFEFHIFDRRGKFEKKALVPLADENVFEFYPYTIHGGKVFQVVDNFDTEVWELHITEIE